MSCKICRLFQSYGSAVVEMRDEMDKAFVKIKEFLYEHENATIVDVVEVPCIAESMCCNS